MLEYPSRASTADATTVSKVFCICRNLAILVYKLNQTGCNMTELRYRHEMRRMIDRAVQLLERGELTWKAVAQWFEAYRVPFEVTCRVLAPYAKK